MGESIVALRVQVCPTPPCIGKEGRFQIVGGNTIHYKKGKQQEMGRDDKKINVHYIHQQNYQSDYIDLPSIEVKLS